MTARTADPDVLTAAAGSDLLAALAALVDRHPDLRITPGDVAGLLDEVTVLLRRARGRVRATARRAGDPAGAAPKAPEPVQPAMPVPASRPEEVPRVLPVPVPVAPVVPGTPRSSPAASMPPGAVLSAFEVPQLAAPWWSAVVGVLRRRGRWFVVLAVVVAVAAGVWELRGSTPPAPARAPAPVVSVTSSAPPPVPADPATVVGAWVAAQRYADAWWSGDAVAVWEALTPELQARYAAADIGRVLAEYPDRPRAVALGAVLLDPATARVMFSTSTGTVAGEQVLLHDGRRWRWQLGAGSVPAAQPTTEVYPR